MVEILIKETLENEFGTEIFLEDGYETINGYKLIFNINNILLYYNCNTCSVTVMDGETSWKFKKLTDSFKLIHELI